MHQGGQLTAAKCTKMHKIDYLFSKIVPPLLGARGESRGGEGGINGLSPCKKSCGRPCLCMTLSLYDPLLTHIWLIVGPYDPYMTHGWPVHDPYYGEIVHAHGWVSIYILETKNITCKCSTGYLQFLILRCFMQWAFQCNFAFLSNKRRIRQLGVTECSTVI